VKDYHAYRIEISEELGERLRRIASLVRSRRPIETRAIDLGRMRSEVDLIVSIYNEAWSRNWGFLPLTDAEPAAVLGALPDPNVPLRPRWNKLWDSDPIRISRLLRTRRRIPRTSLMFFGIDAVLYL